jgi:hypothetical protein
MDAKSNCQIYFLCFNVNDGKQYFIFYIWVAHQSLKIVVSC